MLISPFKLVDDSLAKNLPTKILIGISDFIIGFWWLILAVVDSIALICLIAEHAANFQIIGAVVGSWSVFVLSIKYGKSGWGRLDKFYLIGAAVGISLWWWLKNPLLGLMISLGVITIGCMPTIVKTWRRPKSENKLAWLIWTLSCFFALAAIPKWDLANAAQPVVFTVLEATMMFLTCVRPKLKR